MVDLANILCIRSLASGRIPSVSLGAEEGRESLRSIISGLSLFVVGVLIVIGCFSATIVDFPTGEDVGGKKAGGDPPSVIAAPPFPLSPSSSLPSVEKAVFMLSRMALVRPRKKKLAVDVAFLFSPSPPFPLGWVSFPVGVDEERNEKSFLVELSGPLLNF